MINDSFSLFAKKIRQNKINKNELITIKKEVAEINMRKTYLSKMALIIQRYIRGFLYRKKFKLYLEQINIETIIEYLRDKRKDRIHEHSEEIISFFVLKYINKKRKKKIREKKKEYSINLIKAHLRGIISRKKFKAKITKIKKSKKILIKYIISYKTRLILRSKGIQDILIEIANTKLVLKNMDKQNEINGHDIYDLKIKLNKNLYLFYSTYYQYKDNYIWINEEKIEYNWIYKYLTILKRYKNSFINLNQKRIFQSHLIYKNNDDNNDFNYINNNEDEDKDYQKLNYSNNIMMSKYNYNLIKNKSNKENNNDFNDNDIYEEEKNNIIKSNIFHCNTKVNLSNNIYDYKNYFDRDLEIKERKNSLFSYNNNNDEIYDDNYICTKKKDKKKANSNYKFNNQEEEKNDNYNYIENNNINIEKINCLDADDRPIKPMKIGNNINIDNPFGKRNNDIYYSPNHYNKVNISNNEYKKKESIKQKILNTNNKIDTIENIIDDEEFTIEIHRIKNNQEETPKNNNKIIEYKDIFGTHKKGEDQPICGNKKIDYEQLFKNEENYFYKNPINENKKRNIKNLQHEKPKKKVIYDARKAIEEEKLKKENQVKKEKPSSFREFLKEMKKVSNEDKKNKEKKNINKVNLKKIELNNRINTYDRDESEITNIYTNPNIIKDEDEKEDYIKVIKKRKIKRVSKNTQKISSKEIITRRKLYELEKSPAPHLNYRGIKSRIECWNSSRDKKIKKIINKQYQDNYIDQKEISDFINKRKLKQNYSNNIIINHDNNNNNLHVKKNTDNIKNTDIKIEKYVESKLKKLNTEIENINKMFDIEKYFNEKENKMKNFINIPYIKKEYDYSKKYSHNDKYNELIENIKEQYKILK